MWNVYFVFLDILRESGVTNMFGAAPYIEQEFGLTKREAQAILARWMETYGDGSLTAAERAAKIKEVPTP